MVRMPDEVRQEIDASAVVRTELAGTNPLLPPRWGDIALRDNADQVEKWFRSGLRRDLSIVREDVVMARKSVRGARPLTARGLMERLTYRAAVGVIGELTGIQERTREQHEVFLRAPLEVEGCKYILRADINSYYQYIDHERLVDEVVARSGDDLAVTFAVELLQQESGRHFGIPQASDVSNILGEIYIDPIRRDLTRRGFRTFRYVDDFRVACPSYYDALAALEEMERAARELGLVLNESKTSTPKRSTYEESLNAVSEAEREIFASIDADLDGFDVDSEYDEEEDDQDDITISSLNQGMGEEENDFMSDDERDLEGVSDGQVAAANEVLKRWVLEDVDDTTVTSSSVMSSLLRSAIRVLGQAESTSVLPFIPQVLVYEAQLTPTVCTYLRRLMENHRKQVRDVLDKVCSRRIVSAWQAVWISYAAGELPRRNGGENLDHVKWLVAQLDSNYPAVAAESVLALARRKLVTTQQANDVLQRLPVVHKPTATMALGLLEQKSLDGKSADLLDRLRVEWVLQNWS